MRYHLFPFLIPKDQTWWKIHVGPGLKPNYKATEHAWNNALEMIRRKWYQRIFYQPWLGWEIYGSWEKTEFYYWTPSNQLGGQFWDVWTGDHGFLVIEKTPPPPLDFSRPHAGAKLMFQQNFCVPIEVFSNNEADSMTNLLQFMTYVDPGELAVVQMLLRPVYDKQVDKEFRRVISKIQRDKSAPPNENQEYVSAVMRKYHKPKGEVAIKLIYFADTQEKANSQMDQFVKAFSAFNSDKFNSFDRRRWWKIIRPLFRYEAKKRIFPMRRKENAMIVGTHELAGLLRTPTSAGSSRFHRLRYRQSVANIEMRQSWKKMNPEENLHIGTHFFHFMNFEVYQNLLDAQKSMLVLGGPGTGKTMFLVNYIEQFLKLRTKENRYGMTIIDPNGPLTREILSRIPPEEHDRVRVYEFRKGNVPFNIFENDSPISDNKSARMALGAIKKFDKAFWNPMVEENILNAGIALKKLGIASTGNVQKLLEDDEFRQHVIQMLDENDQDQFGLKEYFRRYDEMDEWRQDFLKGTAMTKLRNLNLCEIGPMLNAHSSAPSWFEPLEKGEIQIFDLSGLFPSEKNFIASVVFSYMQVAIHSRGGKPTEELPFHPLIVDDASMLLEHYYSELELYTQESYRQRFPFVFTVEGISNLIKPELVDAFFRNFGTIASFQAGSPTDAKIISSNLNNFGLTPEDFNSIDPECCYIQMPMEDDRSKLFTLRPNRMEPGPYKDRIEDLRKSTQEYMVQKENKRRKEREELAKKRWEEYNEKLALSQKIQTDKNSLQDESNSQDKAMETKTEQIVTPTEKEAVSMEQEAAASVEKRKEQQIDLKKRLISQIKTTKSPKVRKATPKTNKKDSDFDQFIDLMYGIDLEEEK